MNRITFALALALIGLFAVPVLAQTPAPKIMGWTKNANLGANLSFSSSQDVVGQTDGNSQTYGLNLKSGADRNSASDEWRNSLTVLGSTTKTPSVPRFIKSSDELKLATIYLYSLPNAPDFGPYVSGEAAAPMFSGEDVRSTPQTYRITRHSGPDKVFAGSSAHLTDGFKPLTTKEGVGGFWKAVAQDNLKVELRIGVAALQVDANGQFTVQGTNAAGEIQINELSTINQSGLEAGLSVKGKVDEKSTYELGANAMTPFITNKASDDTRSALRLTNVDGFVKLSSNITSWAAFGYDYHLKIQPQLLERAQQIHLLTLNVNYNLF